MNYLFKLIKILLFTVILMSCASIGPVQITSTELDGYVAEFDKEIVDHGKVWVVFDEYPEGSSVLGTCHYMIVTPNYVTINIKEWEILTDMERKILVLHELGHCVLELNHTIEIAEMNGINDVDRFEDSCPRSIMYPFLLSSECAYDHYDDYIKDLKYRANI